MQGQITCVIGTRAQLIKMAPLILELEKRKLPLQLLMTGQHKQTMDLLLAEFSICTSPQYLYSGPEISGLGQVAGWFIRCLWQAARPRSHLFSHKNHGIVLVHGDTFSTLLGALIGKFWRKKVGHVEAGLRSFRLFHPFPEEITRLLVFRFSDIAFCPGEWAYNNLARYRLRRINTGGNTLIDALRIAQANPSTLSHPTPATSYGVVSLHRFENVFNRTRLVQIIYLLELAAQSYPLVFVMHPTTRKNLEKFDLLHRLEQNERFTIWPRVGYSEFITLIARSRFVITDGGGNQEELSYMNKPTLLMRNASERIEGIGKTAFICNYSENTLATFLSEVDQLASNILEKANLQPTCIIADFLQEHYAETHTP